MARFPWEKDAPWVLYCANASIRGNFYRVSRKESSKPQANLSDSPAFFFKPWQHFQFRHYALKLATYLGAPRHQSKKLLLKQQTIRIIHSFKPESFVCTYLPQLFDNVEWLILHRPSEKNARISNVEFGPWRATEWHPSPNANLSRGSSIGSWKSVVYCCDHHFSITLPVAESRGTFLARILSQNGGCDLRSVSDPTHSIKRILSRWSGQVNLRIVIAKCSGSTVGQIVVRIEEREEREKKIENYSVLRAIIATKHSELARRLETKCPLPLSLSLSLCWERKWRNYLSERGLKLFIADTRFSRAWKSGLGNREAVHYLDFRTGNKPIMDSRRAAFRQTRPSFS